MDVTTINQTIRSLIEDSNADYADDAYLQPLLTMEYTEMLNEMRLYAPDVDEFVVELFNVPPGTPDLSGYMAQGQPLYWLLSPREIEWKLAGQAPFNYIDAEGPLTKLRDIPIPGIAALDCWSYTHFNIGLSLFSAALDLRIRGDFLFPPMSSQADVTQLGQNTMPALAKRVAKFVAMKRGNQQWVTNYGKEADDGFDRVIQGLIQLRQAGYERVDRVNTSNGWPRFSISQ
jgi:hypothetical protein